MEYHLKRAEVTVKFLDGEVFYVTTDLSLERIMLDLEKKLEQKHGVFGFRDAKGVITLFNMQHVRMVQFTEVPEVEPV